MINTGVSEATAYDSGLIRWSEDGRVTCYRGGKVPKT